jgi:hypothetical protein
VSPEEKILDKIQKLLNLSKSPNEFEAKLAMEKAQELLFRHNLSISQVEAIGDQPHESEVIVEEGVHVAKYHQFVGWKMSLGFGISHYFFCKGLSGRHFFFFIGKKSDVEVVTETYKWIMEQAERLADEAMIAYKKTDDYKECPVHGRQFKNSYFQGLVAGITSILHKQWDKLENESEQSRALVVVRGKEVAEFVEKKYPKLSTHHGSDGNVHWGAYSNGKKDASKVQIGTKPRQVGTGGSNLIS